MRKIEHYICEICGTEYRDRLSAEKCEKCHKRPVAIIKSRYVNRTGWSYERRIGDEQYGKSNCNL